MLVMCAPLEFLKYVYSLTLLVFVMCKIFSPSKRTSKKQLSRQSKAPKGQRPKNTRLFRRGSLRLNKEVEKECPVNSIWREHDLDPSRKVSNFSIVSVWVRKFTPVSTTYISYIGTNGSTTVTMSRRKFSLIVSTFFQQYQFGDFNQCLGILREFLLMPRTVMII